MVNNSIIVNKTNNNQIPNYWTF